MPQQESRVKKSLLNARVNLIFYFLTLALSFFSRKIFLDTLGADFVGLTTTLQNLLGFLNLAELGIGSAIGYVLYKPLFDHDEGKINEIISVFGYLYSRIGFIILGAGVVLGGFLPLIFPGTAFEMGIIYFAYVSFLASSLIGYFANYKQTLLGADQKNYVVTAYFQTATIVKTLIQMASAYYTGSYYLWVAIELTFGIIYSIILNWKIRQVYPWLRSEIREGRKLFKKYPEVMRYTKQLFVQKISAVVQWQTTPFLIYSFVNLQVVAFYGNYTIITDKLAQFVNTFLESTGASIGNLIAEKNIVKIKKIFWELLSMRYLIGGIISFSVYILIEPFITLWVGNEYVLNHEILILLTLNIFISYTRGGVMQFLYGFGLFNDVWAPIAEIVINLGAAITCGSIWGLKGVLLGGICSQLLIVGIWKPYFLFSKGFKEPVWKYWLNWARNMLVVLLPWGIILFFIIPFDIIIPLHSFVSWILYALVFVPLYSICCFALSYLIAPGMKEFSHRFIKSKIR